MTTDLRTEVRRLIAAGELPDRLPDTLWGGPGSGAPCFICRKVISRGEIELEFEYTRPGGKSKAKAIFHRPCYETVRKELACIAVETSRALSSSCGEGGGHERAGA